MAGSHSSLVNPGQFEWQMIASTVRFWAASFDPRTKIALPNTTLN
jgi:hypothetical protein